MENDRISAVLSVMLGVGIVLVFISISFITINVEGATNSTVSKVFVWNTEPNITSVIITPSSIDLTPGNTTQVNCTAYIWDYNGWDDVNLTNMTLFHNGVSYNSFDDNNNHYTANVSNGSSNNCNCTQVTSDNASCRCSFDVWYFATNGTWFCNVTVTDNAGNATSNFFYFNDSNNGSATVNVVTAIDVPIEIDYGNLSVSEQSTEKLANVSNFGNTLINISIRAYGGTNASDSANPLNTSLNCDYGNITLSQERFSLAAGTGFSSMINVTNTSTYMGLQLPVRTNDTNYGNDTNTTYWMLEVPLSVGGSCNGTLIFSASVQ